MTPDHVLELRGVRKSYPGFTLKDVSFTLPRGVIGGLIGPNGSGKTTIIKLIMNLVRREAGEIRVFGLDNRANEIAVKSRIGFVYDVPGFWDDQSLDSQRRALGAFYPRWSDGTFRRLAGEFGLPLDKKYKALSHGARTKFALAMALSHEADLLIMDEPTAGLESDLQAGPPPAAVGAAAGRRQVHPLLDAHHQRPRARGGRHHVHPGRRDRLLADARRTARRLGDCPGRRPGRW